FAPSREIRAWPTGGCIHHPGPDHRLDVDDVPEARQGGAVLRPPFVRMTPAPGYFLPCLASSTFFCTSTASVLTVLATFSDSFLANSPLGSQPAAMATTLPPLSIKKFVGMVLVANTFQLSPLESTA